MPKRKNRKLKGEAVRWIRVLVREDRGQRFDMLAGNLNQADAIEQMIDACYRQAVKKGLVPINSDSSLLP